MSKDKTLYVCSDCGAASAKWLGLPNEIRLRDIGGGVTACAVCDGFFFRGQTVALVGAGEGAEPLAQCERFQRAVGGPVARHVFTAEEGAEGHCQTGNLAYSAAVSMDWLDELFGG